MNLFQFNSSNPKLNWKGLKVFKDKGYTYKSIQVQEVNNTLHIRFSGAPRRLGFPSEFFAKVEDYKSLSYNDIVLDIIQQDLINRHLEDAIREHYAENDLKLGYIHWQFMGVQGAGNLDKAQEATNRLDNLLVAKKMEIKGADARDIKRTSGWERGNDNLWRYETVTEFVDCQNVFSERLIQLTNNYQLAKNNEKEAFNRFTNAEKGRYDKENYLTQRKAENALWKNYIETTHRVGEAEEAWRTLKDFQINPEEVFTQELLLAYPLLKEFKIEIFDQTKKSYSAFCSFNEKVIHVSCCKNFEEFNKLLAHEVQHVIQHIEGFAIGGVVDYSNVTELKNPARVKHLNRIIHYRDINNLLDEQAVEQYIQNNNINLSLSVESFLRDMIKQAGLESLLEIEENTLDEPYAIYHRLAGEVEARNVEARMGLTLEQRLSSLALDTVDVEKDEQIFLHKSLAAAVSLKEDDTIYETLKKLIIKAGVNVVELNDGWRFFNGPFSFSKEVQLHAVYHGSQAVFERFEHSFMGTGEGFQAYGWGTYVTEVEGIGKMYANKAAEAGVITFNGYELKDVLNNGYWDNVFSMFLLNASYKSLEQFKSAVQSVYIDGRIAGRRSARVRRFEEQKKKLLQEIENGNIQVPASLGSLYTVEIPIDNGKNYLKWEKKISAAIAEGILDKLMDNIHMYRESVNSFIDQQVWDDDYGMVQLTKEQVELVENEKYAQTLPSEEIRKLLEKYLDLSEDTGEYIYRDLEQITGSNETASAILAQVGLVGVSYPTEYLTGGRDDYARNFVIFNEENLKITNTLQLLQNDSRLYGFVSEDTIYLTSAGMQGNTLVHEYTHLWDNMCKVNNPALWNKGVELMKMTSVWSDVLKDPNYANIINNEFLLASEVHARLTSGNAAELLDKIKKESKALFASLKEWLIDFWHWTKQTFRPWVKRDIETISIEEFINLPICDIILSTELNGLNKKHKSQNKEGAGEDLSTMFKVGAKKKEEYLRLLEKKKPELTQRERTAFINYLDTLDNKKVELLTFKWFLNGSVRLPEDQYKIVEAIKVAQIAKVNPLEYSSPLELINQHQKIKIKGERINPDNVSTLSNKVEFPYGITVYDVDNSLNSQRAMRRIIDTHWGVNANPWCLLARDEYSEEDLSLDSKSNWRLYSGQQKRVAFKDGKLLAFCASEYSDDEDIAWWDRMDEEFQNIPFKKYLPNDEEKRWGIFEFCEYTKSLQGPYKLFSGKSGDKIQKEWRRTSSETDDWFLFIEKETNDFGVKTIKTYSSEGKMNSIEKTGAGPEETVRIELDHEDKNKVIGLHIPHIRTGQYITLTYNNIGEGRDLSLNNYENNLIFGEKNITFDYNGVIYKTFQNPPLDASEKLYREYKSAEYYPDGAVEVIFRERNVYYNQDGEIERVTRYYSEGTERKMVSLLRRGDNRWMLRSDANTSYIYDENGVVKEKMCSKGEKFESFEYENELLKNKILLNSRIAKQGLVLETYRPDGTLEYYRSADAPNIAWKFAEGGQVESLIVYNEELTQEILRLESNMPNGLRVEGQRIYVDSRTKKVALWEGVPEDIIPTNIAKDVGDIKERPNLQEVEEFKYLTQFFIKPGVLTIEGVSDYLELLNKHHLKLANKKQNTYYHGQANAEMDTLFKVGAKKKDEYLRILEKKRPDLTQRERTAFINYLDTLDNKKEELLTFKWFLNGSVRLPEDQYKIVEAIKVGERAKVNPLEYSSPLELINQHQKIKIKGERINPDNVSTLSNKVEYPYGITVYDVADTWQSQREMRRIIDTHWGVNANPWCLLARDERTGDVSEAAEDLWLDVYDGGTKKVAFKDGKLMAFHAVQYSDASDDEDNITWWDRMDNGFAGIPIMRKIENDQYDRIATYLFDESTQTLGQPFNIYSGNKYNGTLRRWRDLDNLSQEVQMLNGQFHGKNILYIGNRIAQEEDFTEGMRDGKFIQVDANNVVQRFLVQKHGYCAGIDYKSILNKPKVSLVHHNSYIKEEIVCDDFLSKEPTFKWRIMGGGRMDIQDLPFDVYREETIISREGVISGEECILKIRKDWDRLAAMPTWNVHYNKSQAQRIYLTKGNYGEEVIIENLERVEGEGYIYDDILNKTKILYDFSGEVVCSENFDILNNRVESGTNVSFSANGYELTRSSDGHIDFLRNEDGKLMLFNDKNNELKTVKSYHYDEKGLLQQYVEYDNYPLDSSFTINRIVNEQWKSKRGEQEREVSLQEIQSILGKAALIYQRHGQGKKVSSSFASLPQYLHPEGVAHKVVKEARYNIRKKNEEIQTFMKYLNSDGSLNKDRALEYYQQIVNEAFNKELQEQIEGTQKKGHIYKLGTPSDILLASGFDNLPIELVASRLTDKSMQENHPFDLSEVENLPDAIQNPIAVMRSATRLDSKVVFTELTHNGKNFIVAIQMNRSKGKIEVNSIRSVHYRTAQNISNLINDGLLDYVNKEKISDWFSKQQYNSADVRESFRDATKIVKEFENPKNQKQNEIRYKINERIMNNDFINIRNRAKDIALNMGVSVNIISQLEDVPRTEVGAQEAIMKGENVKGWYNVKTDQVFIYLPYINSEEEVEKVFYHEVVAHQGMRKLLGEDDFNQLCDRIWREMGEEDRKKGLAYLGVKTQAEVDVSLQRKVADEYIASIAERGRVEKGIWDIIEEFFKKALKKIGFKTKLSENDILGLLRESMINMSLNDNNRKFNEEIERQVEGNLELEHVYSLGSPSPSLLAGGVERLPIFLSTAILEKKASQDYSSSHPFSLENIKNLPDLINNPIAVFESATHPKNKIILIELQEKGKNFVTALRVSADEGDKKRKINSVRSLYPKENQNTIISWINNGLLRWVDKMKIYEYFKTQCPNYKLGENNKINIADEIIQNFDNQKFVLPIAQDSSTEEILFAKGKNAATDTFVNKFTEIIIDKLKDGDIENWKKPWIANVKHMPRNLRGTHYKGFNRMMLYFLQEAKKWEFPVYLTFNQAKSQNININKGEKAVPVTSVNRFAVDKERNIITEKEYRKLPEKEMEKYKLMTSISYFMVFNIEQTNYKELKPKLYDKLCKMYIADKTGVLKDDCKCDILDKMIDEQSWSSEINLTNGDSAHYRVISDDIYIPEKENFYAGNEFYSTLLHEMAHSTGHVSRLDRFDAGNFSFGSKSYAKEELIAELSSMLCGTHVGLGVIPQQNNLAYIKSWSEKIKKEPEFLKEIISDVSKVLTYFTKQLNIKESIAEDLTEELENKNKCSLKI